MTATAVLHDDLESWLAREVQVGAFLASHGLAVSPARLMPPGPHRRDGLWMTVWDYVPHHARGASPPATELGHSLRRLHAALTLFPGELETLMSIHAGIERTLEALKPAPSLSPIDIESLRARLHELTPRVFRFPGSTQPLHGDAGLGNLLRTDDGLLWSDLEDVCTGPIAWDLSGVLVSARMRGASDLFIAEVLEAYGGTQLEELSDFIAAHELSVAVWQRYEAQRRQERGGR